MKALGNRKLMVAICSIGAFTALAFLGRLSGTETVVGIVSVTVGFFGGNVAAHLKKLQQSPATPSSASTAAEKTEGH